MRITTFDPDEGKPCGIEVPLRRLATLPESLETARWQKLLDLIDHLQSCRLEHELWGQIALDELLLLEPEPPDPIRDLQMNQFVDEWRARNPDRANWGDHLSRELRRRFPPKSTVHMSVRVDWRDYTPLRDGLPQMHYRFQVRRPDKIVSDDARAENLVEAERIICEAFGW